MAQQNSINNRSSTLTVDNAFTVTTGTVSINSGTSTLGVSTDASATTVSIATGGAAKAVTVGSTNTTSALTLNSGSGGIKAIGVASVAVSNKNYVTINTSTGALGSDSGPASSISITGDSGGALTGSSFTFTGGSTGLTFSGAGSTETLGGTLAIANGGTNATSMSTSTGIVKYDGTRLVTSSTAKIDSSNRMTNTSQPAFLVYFTSTNPSNVTGDGTVYTVIFDTAKFDQGSNFNLGTGTFTAPVTGNYFFSATIEASNVVGQTSSYLTILATGFTAVGSVSNPLNGQFANIYQVSSHCLIPMTAGDTCVAQITFGGSTKTVGVSATNSYFSGHLVC